MKRILILGGVLMLLATLYVASPFVTAWRMREAVKSADTAYLSGKVDWDRVRDSLKASIKHHGILAEEVSAHGKTQPPSIWQRVKLAFGQPMVDSFVERYVTPEGLPQLYRLKSSYNTNVRGEPDEASLGRVERMERFARRIKRAEFQSLTRVEIEMEDKRQPGRRYASLLELQGFEWKLTRLEVKSAGPTIEAQAAPGPTGMPLQLLQGRIAATPRLP